MIMLPWGICCSSVLRRKCISFLHLKINYSQQRVASRAPSTVHQRNAFEAARYLAHAIQRACIGKNRNGASVRALKGWEIVHGAGEWQKRVQFTTSKWHREGRYGQIGRIRCAVTYERRRDGRIKSDPAKRREKESETGVKQDSSQAWHIHVQLNGRHVQNVRDVRVVVRLGAALAAVSGKSGVSIESHIHIHLHI